MSGDKGISNPAIYVKGQQVKYVPNSLKVKDGRGERNVETQSVGDGVSVPVVFDNDEMKKSNVKFEVYSTPEEIEFFSSLGDLIGEIAIEIADESSGYKRAFSFCTLITDVEYEFASGGKFEVEFEGSQTA